MIVFLNVHAHTRECMRANARVEEPLLVPTSSMQVLSPFYACVASQKGYEEVQEMIVGESKIK